MTRIGYFGGGSALALAFTLALAAPAAAQETEVEEVVVTGSFIRGTPEDAALPVDVIGQEELQKQGSPTTVELLKALPVSNGVLGDTNQFDSRAQGSEGSGSVNLRGLGPQRTLVLVNGRRMSINPFALAGGGAVDTNTIPVAAIGRVEVLKEGAAATYGSDAIGGVVNFITRKGLDGVEVGAAYKWIEGSDGGDYNAHINVGQDWDRADAFLSFGYHHRSELSVAEREWANLGYEDNPEGGWSAAGNPSSFIPLASTANRFRDTQCTALGGYAGFSGTPGPPPLGVTAVCYWHYTPFDNLVEEEDRYQAYGEFNYQIDETTTAHVEVLWSSTDVPHWRTSPSYALLAVPTPSVGGIANQYSIPAANPGLIAYMAANPTITTTNSVTGVNSTIPGSALGFGALVVATRPFAIGGNPMFNYGPSEGRREFDAWRLSGTLSGELSENTNWDVNVTYGRQTGVRTGYDTVVNRYQLALRGYGSLESDAQTNGGCTAAETANWTTGAGNATLGCYYFNPFSSAVPRNVFTGQTTPQHTTALENGVDLTRWFFQELWTEQTAQVLTVEGVLNGQLAWELGGGQIGWAAGAQFRKDFFEADYNDLSNRDINPCIDTPTYGNMACANPNGPFAFLGVGSPTELERSVWAFFGELSLPVTDSIQVQLATRYEHYGAQTGATFDPKLSVRWQLGEMFALRGSVGSTFRAPQVTALTDNFVTSLQSIAGIFRAVDIFGNPDLEPETAKTYSVGFIADVGGFNATLDYWNFDFENPITTDPVGGIVNTIFPNGQTGANFCTTDPTNPNFALVQRFTFTGGVCGPTNIQRLRTNTVNGAGVKTSGVDLLAEYDFGDLGFAELSIGTSLTYVIEYKTEATTVEGVVVAAPFDAVGLLNYQTTAYPLPQWKGDFYVELTRDIHNLRWTTHYIDSYTDQRTAPFAANAYRRDVFTDTFTVPEGKEIDSFITSDLSYRGLLPMETTLVVAIENIFDQEPSFARLDLNYDPFTGDPLGRTVKVSLTKRF